MSEEEKKAIEYFKNLDCDLNTLMRIDLENFKTSKKNLLNLIEKQQNETEELKMKNKKIQEINYRVSKNLLELAETCISKNKVIEKIEKIEFDLFNNNYGEKTKMCLNAQIKVLNELLEED